MKARRMALDGFVGHLLAAFIFLSAPAFVQAGDSGSIRLIAPNAPGSSVDFTARLMSNGLSKVLGKSVVVENLPGAGGVVGTQQLVKAPKDGSTIGMCSDNHVITPHIYKTVPFDPLKDITPISILCLQPRMRLANPAEVNTIRLASPELVRAGQILLVCLDCDLWDSVMVVEKQTLFADADLAGHLSVEEIWDLAIQARCYPADQKARYEFYNVIDEPLNVVIRRINDLTGQGWRIMHVFGSYVILANPTAQLPASTIDEVYATLRDDTHQVVHLSKTRPDRNRLVQYSRTFQCSVSELCGKIILTNPKPKSGEDDILSAHP